MNICGSSILIDPPAGGHIVFPYSDEEQFLGAVSLYAASGLSKGEAVVLIMTYPHCQEVERNLAEQGFDLKALKESDLFICADAARTLNGLMAGATPDPARFGEVIGDIVERARTGRRHVRAFGEMVSLLFMSDPNAALRLEELWNDFLEKQDICLLCTYHLGGPNVQLTQEICAAHSHVVA